MKCPHCSVHFHADTACVNVGRDKYGEWLVYYPDCPNCNSKSFILVYNANVTNARRVVGLVYPLIKTDRDPAPSEVPGAIAQDYNEACVVLKDSPKASAALSRRCLQNVLRDAAKVQHGDLFDEIEEVLQRGTLPSQIAENIDAVRHIGNFGTHPIKSKSAGTIVDVEPDEAEWNLDVLESLFDFYYVAPAKGQAKRDALNKKLADAGKPPIRSGS